MKTRLSAGVEIDLLTEAELRRSLEHDRRLRVEHDAQQKPVPMTIDGSVVLDAAGDGTIEFLPAAPSPGRVWDVRRINITGQDPAATATGTAVVYRGNVVSPTNYVDRTTSLPDVGAWSAGQLTLRPDEALLVRITGGTAGVRMFASAQVMDSPKSVVYEYTPTETDPELARVG